MANPTCKTSLAVTGQKQLKNGRRKLDGNGFPALRKTPNVAGVDEVIGKRPDEPLLNPGPEYYRSYIEPGKRVYLRVPKLFELDELDSNVPECKRTYVTPKRIRRLSLAARIQG
jgi:hypothetical protein